MSEFQTKLNYLKDIIKLILKFLLYFDYLNIEELNYKTQCGGNNKNESATKTQTTENTNTANGNNGNTKSNKSNTEANNGNSNTQATEPNNGSTNASTNIKESLNNRRNNASMSAMNTGDLDDDKDLEKIETSIAGNNFFLYIYSKGKKVLVNTGQVIGDILGLLIAKFFYAATFPTLPFFAVMGFMYSFIKYAAFKIRGL